MKKIVFASTRVDSHNTRLALSALHWMVEQINGSEKVKWIVEHDMSLPHLGKLDDAEVVQGQDGEYYLMAALVPYENSCLIEMPDSTFLIKESFEYSVTFVENFEENCEDIIISFDSTNVGGYYPLMTLFEEIRAESALSFQQKENFRKAHIPDPEVIIQIANHFFDALFAYKIAGKVIDKFQEKLAEDFYELIKVTAKKAVKKLIPLETTITYIFKGTYNTVLFELLTQTRSVEALLECISSEKLQAVIELLNTSKYVFQAVKVQLIYNSDKRTWELNYLIDENGAVVGTAKSFDRRKAVINNMILSNST